jgi:hypothetical protein
MQKEKADIKSTVWKAEAIFSTIVNRQPLPPQIEQSPDPQHYPPPLEQAVETPLSFRAVMVAHEAPLLPSRTACRVAAELSAIALAVANNSLRDSGKMKFKKKSRKGTLTKPKPAKMREREKKKTQGTEIRDTKTQIGSLTCDCSPITKEMSVI